MEKQSKEKKAVDVLYDGSADNRLVYTIEGVTTAVVFRPCTDERYKKWLDEFNLNGNANQMQEESMESTVRLYDDLAKSIENVETDGDADWRDLIPVDEKIDTVNNLLAVAAFRPEAKKDGVRRLTANPTQTLITEAYFNGQVLDQTHTLKAQTIEFKKKYAQIQSKRFKREQTRGLRREPKIQYVPQDVKLGELYDEMLVSATGFSRNEIPLRFKTAVIQYIFETELETESDEKK